MSVSERLEAYLKNNMGETLPTIRYFNGTGNFSDASGKYAAKTLEAAFEEFLKEHE